MIKTFMGILVWQIWPSYSKRYTKYNMDNGLSLWRQKKKKNIFGARNQNSHQISRQFKKNLTAGGLDKNELNCCMWPENFDILIFVSDVGVVRRVKY